MNRRRLHPTIRDQSGEPYNDLREDVWAAIVDVERAERLWKQREPARHGLVGEPWREKPDA